MHITFGMLPHIYQQRVGTAHGLVHVVIQCRIVHQQAQRAFPAIELMGEILEICYCLVYL